MDALRAQWQATWSMLGLAPPADLLERLPTAWCEPQRHYHPFAALDFTIVIT